MRVLSIAILLMLAPAAAQEVSSLTVGDVTYENVTLKNEYPRSFFIRHDGGTAFIDRRAMSEEQVAELLGSSSGGSAVKPMAGGADDSENYEKAKHLLKGEDEGDNWTRGVKLMQSAAESGHPAAQYEWGVILIDGFCVEQDGNKGEEFLRKATDAGDGQAIRQMALWERDPEKMLVGMRQAAEAGDGHAMVYMAMAPTSKPGDDRNGSRAWLDKAFATGDAEVLVHAASMLMDLARNPKAVEWFEMSKEEMEAKSIETLRAGCKENVLDAYCGLALMLRRGGGVEKNETESEELMQTFKRLAGQKAARGSIAARINLMKGLQISGEEEADAEVLRLATEVLNKSNYPGHYTAAALFGVRSVEGKDPKSTEGIRRALAWLKERQAQKNHEGLADLIKGYESRLAKASPETASE
jgi:TPR repeat protein